MACIKSANRSASVAFSPDAPYLAAGTMAGAVDLSFSSSANIEIFKLDFQSEDRELPVVGEAPSTERFNRLSWGKTGSGTEEFSLGLIAGGLVDGTINIWNPQALIRSENIESALVGKFPKHTGPVRGLEFNINSPNLLASGAVEGEICIWDLANPAEPTLFPPLKSAGSAQSEVSFLSWNHKVQHILASTSSNGATVVWDLKRQKQVISFSDPDKRRNSVLQWNPDAATQLIVASDDDNSPALRLWDVRNTISPIKEFVGHTKGVIAMSWCPIDSSYLLTCAKDNRTICWDTDTGEIVCELPVGTNWNFDVHWYPKIPGLISASSFDGKIGIHNIEGCSRFGVGESDFGAANLRAPKWSKRPVGASFGFGGKLVSFHPGPSTGNSDQKRSQGNSEVYVHDLVTESNLVTRSNDFEKAINGEKSLLRDLCDKKLLESISEDDKETWGFLKVMFEDDGTARTKLLTHLGFSVPDNLQEDSQETGADERIDSSPELAAETDTVTFPTDNAEDFFNNLQSPKADLSLFPHGDNSVVEGGAMPNGEQMHQELDGEGESNISSFDESIQRALVLGDYKEAVSQCISANRMADALVIAHVGGASLWESTRDQYLKKSHSPYLKVVAAMVNNDLMSLVKTRPLSSWKETLALLCTFADRKEWTVLCDSLASRLMAAGNTLAATLCYICAGNIDQTVEIWSRSLKREHEGKTYADLLQDLMEKTIVLALATGQKQFSASLSKLVENYAELLASQGLLTTAMEYLKLLGSEDVSQELAILRDRIALSSTETEAPIASPFDNTPLPQDPYEYYPQQPQQPGVPSYPQQSQQPGVPSYPQQSQQPGVPSYPQQSQQPGVPSYSGGYSGPNNYNEGGYPPTYQVPSSQMFLPSQTPQAPQQSYPTQPAVRPFVPTVPRQLKNPEQYQQPTLASQLYPGAPNSAYQTGPPAPSSLGSVPSQVAPVPGPNLTQAPASIPRSFMPVTNSGYPQRPGMSPMQPPSPPTAQVAPAVTPATPPPTVQTVDTSNVSAQQRPVIITLTRLFNETSEALGGSRANPAKKREIEDNSRKIGALFAKLNSGDISKNASDKLVELCQSLDNGDYSTALQIQVLLTTSEWDECNFWLATLKRMIKTRQNVRIN